MVADRVCLFPSTQENEMFAAALVEICKEFPFKAIRIEGLLSQVGPGFSIEAESDVFPQKMRSTVFFTQQAFEPVTVEEKVRQILQKWKNFCSKWEKTGVATFWQ